MDRRPPYLRCLDRSHGGQIWRVDGALVRDRVDVEFTNVHHHLTRPYIPRSEIWIDRAARGAEEWQLWALHARIERALMASGHPYLSALRMAGRVEARERRLAVGVDGPMSAREVREAARRRPLGRVGRHEVWLVRGRAVRDLACVDFTLGGHGLRYRFIPRGEIWIDDAVRPAERPVVLHHEVVELDLMLEGMRYADAHRRASRSEWLLRRARPGEVRDTLLANAGA